MALSQAGSSGLPARTPSPVDLTSLRGLDVNARYHAKRSGGDFFDAVIVGSRLIFLLTDIAGPTSEAHGIAAEAQAAFKQTARHLFALAGANESESIAALTHEVNRAIIDAVNGVRMAPTFLGCFNLTLGIMTYCNAGQMVAVFRDARGSQVLERGGVPLGLFTHVTYEPASLAFQPEDKLLLVTKGIIQTHRGNAEFGVDRIQRILEQSDGNSAAEICDIVLREAYDFGQKHAHDDLTAVAMIRKKAEQPSSLS